MKILPIICFMCLAIHSHAQQYNRKKICGTDTIHVHHFPERGGGFRFKAFECTQVSDLGIRFDMAYNSYSYSNKTRSWLGNHNGPLLGIVVAYRNFNAGFYFKLATVNPKSELIFGGDTLKNNAQLNPVKLEFNLSYSIDFKYNFSLEPYVGVTRHEFRVVNEEEIGQTFSIPTTRGLTAGITLNKYFKVKEFKFVAIFVRYGYGFANFRTVNGQLDQGYRDLSIGLSYKAFYKRPIYDRIR